MAQTIQQFIDQIQNNSLLVTLLGGGIIFTLFRYLTTIVRSIWNFIVAFISFEIVGRWTNDYYDGSITTLKPLMFLMDKNSKVIWEKTYELTRVNDNADDYDRRVKPTNHGFSVRWMYGSLVVIYKDYDTNAMKVTTTLTIRVYFANKKKFMSRIVQEIQDIKFTENSNVVSVTSTNGVDTYKPKRSIDSVYSTGDYVKDIYNDAVKFIGNKDLYYKCGIPYKRNYLFYGKPGTGKTSCVLALASELNWDIVMVDIQKTRIESLIRELNQRTKTIFLFEDVDAMSRGLTTKQVDNKDNNQSHHLDVEEVGDISLGELLNISDGLMTPNGCICIYTTNHIESLDPSFLRDGRMDYKVEFTDLDSKASRKMIKDKLGLEVSFLIKESLSPATLQEKILQVLIGKKTKEQFLEEIRK